MTAKIRLDHRISIEHIQQVPLVGSVREGPRSNDQSFDVELVGVEQKADDRLKIIRITLEFVRHVAFLDRTDGREVGRDDDAKSSCRFACRVDLGRSRSRRGRWFVRHDGTDEQERKHEERQRNQPEWHARRLHG